MMHKSAWVLVLALAWAAAAISGCKRETPAPLPTTAPATQAATAPATRPVVGDYVEVIRAAHPQVPATQPLVVPVDLNDAGHYRLAWPVHLDLRGDLWFTHPDAPPLEQVLADEEINRQQTHIVPQPIRFAVWAPDEQGKWFPRVVVADPASDSLEWRWQGQRHPLPAERGYRWSDALLLNDGSVAVPGRRGVSIFSFEPRYNENYHSVVASVTEASGRVATSRPAFPATPTAVATGGGGPGVPASGHDVGRAAATQSISTSSPIDPNPPQLLLDPRGLLAWSPWDGATPGGRGAVRFVDGKWMPLGPEQNWPEKIVHLVPLLDGSVLQLFRDEGDAAGAESDAAGARGAAAARGAGRGIGAGGGSAVKLALATLDAAAVDEQAIAALVEQLSDDDAQKRESAFAELTRYGTASWPVLEKLKDDQPAEAMMRIEHLLRDRLQPTLGGRTPVDGRIGVASRVEGGGVLLHLPSGVSIPRQDGTAEVVKPAWISIRPGRAIELLPPVLVKEATPKQTRFFAFGDEWLISDAAHGPRRLYGNHLEAMLAKSEAAFGHVVGADRRGRWVFRKSPDGNETLLLDPTIPDPTPKLPVWLMQIKGGKVGWNRKDYPAINRGGRRHSWILHEEGWTPLDERKDQLITELTDIRRAPWAIALNDAPPAPSGQRQPATRSTVAPPATTQTMPSGTTTAATQPLTPPILVDAEGRRYHDGRAALHVIDRDGNQRIWPLPANAVGADDADVTLLRTADGTLFLFNAPGRVVRIKPNARPADDAANAGGSSPTTAPAGLFRVEAVFTRRIPTPGTIHRIWLDPAGRIIMAYDKDRLAVMFPGGRIPHEIHLMIPAAELDDPEP